MQFYHIQLDQACLVHHSEALPSSFNTFWFFFIFNGFIVACPCPPLHYLLMSLSRLCCSTTPVFPPVPCMMVWHSKPVPDHKALFSLCSSFSSLLLSLLLSVSLPSLLPCSLICSRGRGLVTRLQDYHITSFSLLEDLRLFATYGPLRHTSTLFSEAVYFINNLLILISLTFSLAPQKSRVCVTCVCITSYYSVL